MPAAPSKWLTFVFTAPTCSARLRDWPMVLHKAPT